MKRAKVLAVVVGSFAMLGLLLSPVPALATSILDFSLLVPTGGSISYAGGSAPLVGSAITVDKVTGLGTPLNTGVARNCIGCTLTFTTGAHSGSLWNWVGPGIVSMSGTVDLNNSGTINAGDATGVLLSGTFSSAEVDPTTSGIFKVAISDFTDTKHAALTGFYGLPGVSYPYSGNFSLNFQLASPATAPAAFSSSILTSGDVLNSTVPEASSLLLLGAGLLSLAFWGRKKLGDGRS